MDNEIDRAIRGNYEADEIQDAVKLLESNGFILIRSNGHIVYACGTVRIAIAHQRIVSVGVMRSIYKAIKQANEISMSQNQEIKAA